MKTKRGWIEAAKEKSGAFVSGSYYAVEVDTGEDYSKKGHLRLTLADCVRTITWTFGAPGDKRAVAKIKKVKALVDEIYEFLVPENKR